MTRLITVPNRINSLGLLISETRRAGFYKGKESDFNTEEFPFHNT